MHITNDTSLHDLQTGFSDRFPGLKLEFIFNGKEKLNLTSRLSNSFPYVSIREICPDCPPEGIDIEETMTTADVERMLETCFHLPAHVYVQLKGYWQKNKGTGKIRLKDLPLENK